MMSIDEYKELSTANAAAMQKFHTERIKTHSAEPKPTFTVSVDSEKQEPIKSLQTYERRITNKIKAISDKALWLNQDAIKLDRFVLPVSTINLPQFDSSGARNGYQYEPVIDLTTLYSEYEKIANSKHYTYRTKTKEEQRAYNRLQKSRRRKALKALEYQQELSQKQRKEKAKTHIPSSIINDFIASLNRKDALSLAHKPTADNPKLNQRPIKTYELINDMNEVKTLTEYFRTHSTAEKLDFKKFWTAEIFHKGKVISMYHYYKLK